MCFGLQPQYVMEVYRSINFMILGEGVIMKDLAIRKGCVSECVGCLL